MKKVLSIALCFLLLLTTVGCGGATQMNEPAPRLSESCDYVLCRGTDTDGNVFELVANQEESALGYEITVGVIKNNEWLYPLSTDFPFLGERGLFHVESPMGERSGSSLSQPAVVIKNLYFVDSGAFLMECYTTVSGIKLFDHTMIMFSCDTLESYEIDLLDHSWIYTRSEPKIYNSGAVASYGFIQTENGKILLKETIHNKPSNGSDDEYNLYLFDTKSFEKSQIADHVDNSPCGALSEGLILAYHDSEFGYAFYDTNWNRVIDLSAYDIKSLKNHRFENGTYTFIAENNIGNKFEVTIDKQGNVLSEVAQ